MLMYLLLIIPVGMLINIEVALEYSRRHPDKVANRSTTWDKWCFNVCVANPVSPMCWQFPLFGKHNSKYDYLLKCIEEEL